MDGWLNGYWLKFLNSYFVKDSVTFPLKYNRYMINVVVMLNTWVSSAMTRQNVLCEIKKKRKGVTVFSGAWLRFFFNAQVGRDP